MISVLWAAHSRVVVVIPGSRYRLSDRSMINFDQSSFNPRHPRLQYHHDHPKVRSLCLDTRYNARTLGSALQSPGFRDPPRYGVASGTSMAWA